MISFRRGRSSVGVVFSLVLLIAGSTLILASQAVAPFAPGTVLIGRGQAPISHRIDRERYWFIRRGLQFGVPRHAYRRAVAQMRAMEAAQGRAARVTRSSGGAFTWSFIGPEPMTNAMPNFGGIIPGSTYNSSGRVSAIAADESTPGRIVVGGANGGVWISSDDGATFVPVFDSEPTQAIGAIALDSVSTNPSTIYVGTGEGNAADSYYGQGIFKSTDLGASWAALAPGTFDNVAFTRLAIDTSRNPPVLFATTTGAASLGRADPVFQVGDSSKFGLWRSSDGGNSWSQYPASAFANCATSPSNCAADDVTIDPRNPSQIYTAIDSVGVFRSSDGGGSFAPVCFTGDVPCSLPGPSGLSGLSRVSLAVGPPSLGAPAACSGGEEACGIAYATVGASDGNEYAGFFRSTDGGVTWTAGNVPTFVNQSLIAIDGTNPADFSQSNYDQALIVSPSDPATVFFGGVGIYRSTDSGTSWAFIAGNGGVHSDQHSLVIGPDGDTIYLGDDGGAFKFSASAISTGGAAFSSLNDTLGVAQIQTIAPHPTLDSRLIAGFQDNGTDVYTGSLTWVQVETGDGGFTIYDKRNPNFVYHTFGSAGPSTIVGGVSSNGGSSWLDFAIDFSLLTHDTFGFYPPLASDPAVAKRVLTGGNATYVLNFVNDTVAAQSLERIGPFGCGAPNCALQDIEFVPTDHRKAWALSTQQGAHPFRLFTTKQANLDANASWKEVTGNLGFDPAATQATGISPDPRRAAVAYLSLSGFSAETGIGHIFRTADFGVTWTEADGAGSAAPLPDVPVLRVLVDNTDKSGNTLYAGTDIGMFRSTDAGADWTAFNLGVIPAVPVFDVEQNRNGTIFLGTHGRGAYASVGPVSGPPAPATLRTGPASLAFRSEVFLDDQSAVTAPRFVTLSNPKNPSQNRTIVISGVQASGDFIVPSNVCLAALDPGAKCKIPVAFSPTGAGARTGQLTIASDATGGTTTVPLIGTGASAALSIEPRVVKFGRVRFGHSSAPRKIVVSNENPAPITITISNILPENTDFMIPSDTCSGAILGPGARCVVKVQFRPLTKGDDIGAVTIGNNTAFGPQTVLLNGFGE